MGGSGVTLDKVEIEISANAGKANENISRLADTLSELKNSVKGGSNNLTKLADSLKKLKSATSGLDNVSKNLSATNKIVNSLSKFSSIPSSTGLSKLVKDIDKIPKAFSKFDSKTISNISRVSNELAQALTPLSDKLDRIGRGFSAVSGLADRYGKSISRVGSYTKQSFALSKQLTNNLTSLKDRMKSIHKTSDAMLKSLGRSLSSTTSKIKQVGLSLLGTRTIFTATRKAVSEYMQMDAELSWQMTNNWRALGAQLAPAIENVMYLFKQFVRVVYSVILALTGIDLIARANEKAMKGWGKSAKDTLGNLQKFDDLNVVEFPKGSGGDDNSLIELDTIDLSPIQKVIDWVRKLRDEIKEAWNSGQWQGVGEVFADGLNAALEAMNFNALEKKLKDVAKKFGDFLRGVVIRLDWDMVGVRITQGLSIIPRTLANIFDEIPWSELGKGLNDALKNFSPKKIINAIGDAFTGLVGGLQDAFLQIDPTAIAFVITDTIVSVLKNIHKFFSVIKWDELGKAIHDTIVNIDWGAIWQAVVDTAKEAFNGLTDFISSLTGLDSGVVETIARAFVTIGEVFVTYKLVSLVGTFVDKLILLGTSPIGAIALGLVFIAEVIKDIIDISKDPSSAENWEKLSNALLTFGAVAGVLLLAYVAMTKLGKGTKEISTVAKGAKGALDFGSLFGDVGKALIFISILGGVALVLHEISELLKTMSETGTSVASVFGVLATVVAVVVALMAAIKLLGPGMTAGLIPFTIVMIEIAAILAVIALTLPVILDAAADFIERVAPKLGELLTIIGDIILGIIFSLGTILPPIIKSIGTIFTTIFDGIAKVVKTVGDTIVRVLDAVGRLASTIFNSIISFIERLGPAVNILVDNLITATTKLINFMVSGIEWMVNGIIDGINGLSAGLRKVGNKLFELIGVDVTFNPISHVSLNRFYPQLETGTNRIPQDGPYYLHANEAVVPKKYNPALGGGANDETNRRLDTLINIMENIDTTTIVNIGNRQLYKEQKKYTNNQVNKYGTIAVQ